MAGITSEKGNAMTGQLPQQKTAKSYFRIIGNDHRNILKRHGHFFRTIGGFIQQLMIFETQAAVLANMDNTPSRQATFGLPNG